MKYIFRYLDGAMNETDMGERVNGEEVPFTSEEKCKEEMNQMASYGARVSGVVEVEDDYKLYKPDYESPKSK